MMNHATNTISAAEKTLSLARIAVQLDVELRGDDIPFSHISINSRTLQPGDLFIAIRGDNFDAHQFIRQAEAKGASALVVETDMDSQLPVIQVTDTRLALGMIASIWRGDFNLPMVGITGSCGKTTVKEMTSAIFDQHFSGHVLSTQGNLNNEIGVPLTLMRLNQEHQAAVIELGANHQGEIGYLVNLLQPDIAVITNCAHAHIEGFGSIQGVAKAKGEIYSGLVDAGTAIINADDEYADYWRKTCQDISQQTGRKIKIRSFGIDRPADVSASYQQTEAGLKISIACQQGSVSLNLPQWGKHNVYNALAAAAVSLVAGCDLSEIKRGLENFTHIAGRLELKQGINGSIIYDDTYNANPVSVKAGIEAIHHIPGNTIVVLGDMGELGESSETLHFQLGVELAELDIAQLYTLGQLSKAICKGFTQSRLKINRPANARSFTGRDELINTLSNEINSSSVVLIKGSRSMEMESVVVAIEMNTGHQAEQVHEVKDADRKLHGSHSCY